MLGANDERGGGADGGKEDEDDEDDDDDGDGDGDDDGGGWAGSKHRPRQLVVGVGEANG